MHYPQKLPCALSNIWSVFCPDSFTLFRIPYERSPAASSSCRHVTLIQVISSFSLHLHSIPANEIPVCLFFQHWKDPGLLLVLEIADTSTINITQWVLCEYVLFSWPIARSEAGLCVYGLAL